MFELYRVFKLEKTPLAYISYAMAILFYVSRLFAGVVEPMALIMLFLILLMFVYVFSYPKYEAKDVMAIFFGLFYIAVMLSYVYQIRVLESGGIYVVLLFLGSWGNDTLAYCAGRLFGKHKMSPVLSPKKTIEGAVGGVAGAGLLGFLYSLIAKNFILTDSNLGLVFAVICMVGALLSIIGDLAASAIKRNYDIKDYGTLIPGHGGILDRFDSVIFIAPIIYYFLIYTVGA